jgi:predicted alpha/beta-fold hydrolase
VVLLLHGLEGSSQRAYIRIAMEALQQVDIQAVALNFRSCSGETNRHPRFYHSGETGDPRWVIQTLRERFPHRPVGALGFSLGGNVLLRLLYESPGLVDAAAVVSVPFDLAAGTDALSSGPMGRLYTRYFLNPLKAKVLAKKTQLSGRINLAKVLSARTLRDFDEHATAPIHGFDDAKDYYARCSSAAILSEIRTPTLILHAEDDPFLVADALPREAFHSNPCLRTRLVERGGHLGFIGSGAYPDPSVSWNVGQGENFGVHFWAEMTSALTLAAWLQDSPPESARANAPVRGLQSSPPADPAPE